MESISASTKFFSSNIPETDKISISLGRCGKKLFLPQSKEWKVLHLPHYAMLLYGWEAWPMTVEDTRNLSISNQPFTMKFHMTA